MPTDAGLIQRIIYLKKEDWRKVRCIFSYQGLQGHWSLSQLLLFFSSSSFSLNPTPPQIIIMLSSLSTHGTNLRQNLTQALNFALVLSTAFMLWKGLSIFTASSSPIVVVLSGSMEPAFQRGDLLFLWNRGERAEVGEIVVYNVRGKDIPIVHRTVRTFPDTSGQGKKKG